MLSSDPDNLLMWFLGSPPADVWHAPLATKRSIYKPMQAGPSRNTSGVQKIDFICISRITWTNVGQALRRHMTYLDHTALYVTDIIICYWCRGLVLSGRIPNNGPWQQGSWGQHGAHLGPTGPMWAPCGPHVGPMNLSIWGSYCV